jgi:thiosulfate/3-mercaptopyruvate sulfurtransferase
LPFARHMVHILQEIRVVEEPIMEGYTRPELLAEPDWFWDHREDPNVRLIDCDSSEAYRRAHIPGAVALPAHPWLKEGTELTETPPGSYLSRAPTGLHVMSPERFAEVMSRLGVSEDTTVVAYDGYNMSFSTRLWWVLNYYGHTNAKVLNGGWQRWLTEGRPVTFRETLPEPGHFTPRTNDALMCRLDDLKARFDDPEVQVINVLPRGAYLGTVNPSGSKRVGHIPGSLNLPIEAFVTGDDRQAFKPASELRSVLAEAGASSEKETVVHCQAGVRTTMGVFVLSLLGWDRVRAYDASMAEWVNRDDTPLVAEEG